MVDFDNFDLNYANNNEFRGCLMHFRDCASLGMFLQEYLIFAISYI